MVGKNNGRRPSQKPKKPKTPKTQQRRALMGMSFERSVENLSVAGRRTLVLLNLNRRRQPINTREDSTSILLDRTSPELGWLHPGWLVEDRQMLTGKRRVYRNYYDPVGNMYTRKHIVEAIFQRIENNRDVIILDE